MAKKQAFYYKITHKTPKSQTTMKEKNDATGGEGAMEATMGSPWWRLSGM